MKRRDDAFLARRDSFLLGPDVSFPGEAEVSWVAEFAPSVENDPKQAYSVCIGGRRIASFSRKTVERSFFRQSGLAQAIDNDRWGRRLCRKPFDCELRVETTRLR
jgi:hypothetical protein